jgi:Fe-S cluster assembly protein SufB
MNDDTAIKDQAAREAAAAVADYEHGWSSDIDTEFAPKGLSEDTVRFISAKKNEPEWMLEWRLKAYRHWLTMEMPDWAKLNVPIHRLSGRLLLRRAQGQAQAGQSGRGRSRNPARL